MKIPADKKKQAELFESHMREIMTASASGELSFNAFLTLLSVVVEDVIGGARALEFGRDPHRWLEGNDDRMMGAVAALYIMAHKEFNIMPVILAGNWRKAIMAVLAPAMNLANEKNDRRLQ